MPVKPLDELVDELVDELANELWGDELSVNELSVNELSVDGLSPHRDIIKDGNLPLSFGICEHGFISESLWCQCKKKHFSSSLMVLNSFWPCLIFL
jgi:hypothetical protein